MLVALKNELHQGPLTAFAKRYQPAWKFLRAEKVLDAGDPQGVSTRWVKKITAELLGRFLWMIERLFLTPDKFLSGVRGRAKITQNG